MHICFICTNMINMFAAQLYFNFHWLKFNMVVVHIHIYIVPYPYHSTFASLHSCHGSIQVPSFKRVWQVTKFIFELNAWQFGHTLQCQLLLVDRVTFKESPSCIHSGWNKDLSSDEKQCTSRRMSAKGSWSYRTYDDVPQKGVPVPVN